jgi:predicted RNA-binding Zn-ribbon protein involved in translation (DUF1610 family)
MMGRYGSDQLSFVILVVGMLLVLLDSFVKTSLLTILVFLLLALSVFRMFSKNLPARSRENAAFLKIWYRIKHVFKQEKTKLQDKKTHRFFKCPGCKTTLRVPKGKGKISVTCPKCGERFIKKT